jgi:hypothetical protein
LAEEETAHPANYHSCRYAKDEMRKKKQPQGTPKKNRNGKVFSSNLIKQNVSFATALRGHTDQKIHQETTASTSTSVPKPSKIKQKETGQSVPASSVNIETQDNML